MIKDDMFLYFTYNGIHSSEFGAFYENNGQDLSFPFSQTISQKTASPLYQNNSLYLGSAKEGRSFNMSLIVSDKTLLETEEIFEWLDASKPGILSIDYRPNFEYKVLITSIGPPQIFPREFANGVVKNILVFSIVFTTYGNHLAEMVNPYLLNPAEMPVNKMIYEPDYMYPIGYSTAKNTYRLINWSNEKQYLKATVNSKSLTIDKTDSKGASTFYQYSITGGAVQVDTEIGALTKGGKLLEFTETNSTVFSKGPMSIDPGLIYSGKIELKPSAAKLEVTIDDSFVKKGDIGQSKNFILVLQQEINENTKTVKLDMKKGDPVTGVYPGTMQGGSPKIFMPVYMMGSLVPGTRRISFTPASSGITAGVHKVKIAAITEIKTTLDASGTIDYLLKYRKGV